LRYRNLGDNNIIFVEPGTQVNGRRVSADALSCCQRSAALLDGPPTDIARRSKRRCNISCLYFYGRSWHSRPRVLRQLVRKRASSQQSRDVNPVDYRQWRAMQQRVHQVSILDAGEMR